MPDLSIITPSFNQGRFIERTIKSVLEQDTAGRGLEYLVVDGGSTDETLCVLTRYGQRMRWISEKDRGQADAINKGLRMTSGSVIGWVNSDDVYYPGAVRAACDFLDQHPFVDIVYGDANYIDTDGGVIGTYPTEPFDFNRLKDTCYLCQPAVFFRRSILERFGGLDERLHYTMDYQFWLRLARGGARFAHLSHVLAGWRLHPEIKTLSNRLAVHHETNRMMLEQFGRVPDRWIYNYAHAYLEQTRIDPTQNLRFALALAAITWYASMRWNHAVAPSIRETTSIWMKDGVKHLGWSLRARACALLK